MRKIINKIKDWQLDIRESERRQYVILSAAVAVFLLAFMFNRYVLQRSTILLNIQNPAVEIKIDGQPVKLQPVDNDTYKFITTPGKHTVTITAEGNVNHRELIEAKAARTVEITPALSIAPNPESDEIGAVDWLSQSTDKTKLYYLGRDGTTLIRYNLPGGQRVAISDPGFRQVAGLTWAPEHDHVIMKSSKNIWYLFDFTKPDFVRSELKPIADPSVIDIKFDPAHPRVGFIEYRDNTPVFGVASAGLQDKDVLTVLDKLRAPEFVWAPNGRVVAILENQQYNLSNLFIYDLAADTLTSVAGARSVERVSFSPDSQRLLYEQHPNSEEAVILGLFNLSDQQRHELGNLARPGAAIWHSDSNAITASIKTADDQVELEKINIQSDNFPTQPYKFTPQTTDSFDAIFMSDNEETLYFIAQRVLYSFPLSSSN